MDDLELENIVKRLEKAERVIESYKRLFRLVVERFRDSDDEDETPDDIKEMFEVLDYDTV